MKSYLSIGRDVLDIPIRAFAKLDGSNIRAEWVRKTGFHKFGSRHVLIDETHPHLGQAIPLFQKKYGDALSEIFRDARYERATVFVEFFGAKSFAGIHDPTDPTLDVVLFDIDVYKKGLLTPGEFLRLTGDKVETAPVLYTGKANEPFLESVRAGTLDGMPFEGVVCKGDPLKRGYPPAMFKVKSRAWIAAVTERYKDDPKLLNELL